VRGRTRAREALPVNKRGGGSIRIPARKALGGLAEFDSDNSHRRNEPEYSRSDAEAQRRKSECEDRRATKALSRRHSDTAKNTRRRIHCLALRRRVAARVFRSFCYNYVDNRRRLDAKLRSASRPEPALDSIAGGGPSSPGELYQMYQIASLPRQQRGRTGRAHFRSSRYGPLVID
jgi:hypothetical protein